MSQSLFRRLPSVQELLDSPPLRGLVQTVNRSTVTHGVREFLDRMRAEVRSATADMPAPTDLAERIAKWLSAREAAPPSPAFNATGVLFSSRIAGAMLAEEAYQALVGAARERLLDSTTTPLHDPRVERRLAELAGAEAAAVFHAGPGALLATLATLAPGLEVLVSRGQICDVEGMPLPELVAASRARLREVGATNGAYIEDFAAFALGEAGALLRLHPESYSVRGHQREPALDELVALGKDRHLPVVVHLGVGGILPIPQSSPSPPGGPACAAEVLRGGADLCLMRGSGLFGGPDCGIVMGRREWVERIVEHPLRMALRPDRLTLAALDATLELYRAQPISWSAIPIAALINAPLENLRNRAERMAAQWSALPTLAAATPVAMQARLTEGGGDEHTLPSWGIRLEPRSLSLVDLDAALRRQQPAVVGRVEQDQVVLDLRGILPRQDMSLVEAVEAALSPESPPAT